MNDTNFDQVGRVVANRHLLPNLGGQGEVEVAQPLEVDAVPVDAPSFGYGEQQQVQLLGRLWQPGQEAAGLPPRLRRHPRLAVDAPVVVLDLEPMEPVVQLRQAQVRFGRGDLGEA